MSEFINNLQTQHPWQELKKHLAKEYGHIIDEQDAQHKLNTVQKQPGQRMQQYICEIDDIIAHITDDPQSIDSQAKAAFIQGSGDDKLIRKLLNKSMWTYDECKQYALKYEYTEDKMNTHKKNTEISVGAVSVQPVHQASPVNKTDMVCERCDKHGHQAYQCIMPVEKLPPHKLPQWYVDKLKKKQQKETDQMNKGSSGRGCHGNFGYGGQHQGYSNNTTQILPPYPYPHPVYPPPVPRDTRFGHPPLALPQQHPNGDPRRGSNNGYRA